MSMTPRERAEKLVEGWFNRWEHSSVYEAMPFLIDDIATALEQSAVPDENDVPLVGSPQAGIEYKLKATDSRERPALNPSTPPEPQAPTSSNFSQQLLVKVREALEFIVNREDFSFAECSVAEEIWNKAKEALALLDGGGE